MGHHDSQAKIDRHRTACRAPSATLCSKRNAPGSLPGHPMARAPGCPSMSAGSYRRPHHLLPFVHITQLPTSLVAPPRIPYRLSHAYKTFSYTSHAYAACTCVTAKVADFSAVQVLHHFLTRLVAGSALASNSAARAGLVFLPVLFRVARGTDRGPWTVVLSLSSVKWVLALLRRTLGVCITGCILSIDYARAVREISAIKMVGEPGNCRSCIDRDL